jgi:hypothetical protein
VRHEGHVAVGVVLVFRGVGSADWIAGVVGGRKAIADVGGDDLRGLVIGVVARPSSRTHLVGHGLQVAGGIVGVGLHVGAHGGSVPGLGKAGAEGIVIGDLLRRAEDATVLTEVLAAGGAEQAIQWVVGVVAGGIDPLVVEVDDVLCVGGVAYASDVAHWIVVIGEILNGLLIGREGAWTVRGESGQAEGLRIVRVVGDSLVGGGLIAKGNVDALAAFVVVDSEDGVKAGGRGIEQLAGRSRLL